MKQEFVSAEAQNHSMEAQSTEPLMLRQAELQKQADSFVRLNEMEKELLLVEQVCHQAGKKRQDILETKKKLQKQTEELEQIVNPGDTSQVKLEKVQTEKKQIAERMQRLQELEKNVWRLSIWKLRNSRWWLIIGVHLRSGIRQMRITRKLSEIGMIRSVENWQRTYRREHRVRSVEVRHIRKRHIVTELL